MAISTNKVASFKCQFENPMAPWDGERSKNPFLVVVLLDSIPNDRCGGGGLARFRVELESVELILSENVDDDVS